MKVKNLAAGAAVAAAIGLTGVLGTGSAAAAPAPSAGTAAELPAQRAAASWHQLELWSNLSGCQFSQMMKSYPTTCAYGQWGSTGSYGYVLWGWY